MGSLFPHFKDIIRFFSEISSFFIENMPENLYNKVQLDIMSRAMDIAGVEKPTKTSRSPNFRISEDSMKNSPLKSHFRHIVEIHEQERKRNGEKKAKCKIQLEET